MLFTVMWGKPVTIRLLDPPLHEFLPHEDHELKEIAAEMKLSIDTVRQRVLELSETNPMLGHRGCRLGITFPEITAMQARAIFEAAAECAEGAAIPEIMVPLVGFDKELSNQREIIEHEHQRVEQRL
jgi:pyruvate,orthophosphate dikinase